MAFRHGVYKQEVPTSLLSPVQTEAGLPVIVGTAPIHLASGEGALSNVNKPQLIYNYDEAVSMFGFSDDWEKYTLCEFIYSQFALFAVFPCMLINVLDPEKHKETVAPASFTITNGQANLGQNVILAKGITFEGETTYTAGADYSLGYDESGNEILTVIKGEKLATVSTVKAGFTRIKPENVTAYDIIGGIDANTDAKTGFELVNSVFPKFRMIPGLLGSPKWSGNPEVAAVMRAKAENINGVFTAMSMVDIPSDSGGADKYSEAPEWKNQHNYTGIHEIVCWPKVKLGDRVFHLSTQLIGAMNTTDTGNDDTPYVSPSNKPLQIDACVTDDGIEVDLGLETANYLNGQGIVTALNWTGGWRAWGNRTGAHPDNTDVKDKFISVRRMFDWIGNEFVRTMWQNVDADMSLRLIRAVLNSYNIRLDGLSARGYILGGRIEFKSTENPATDLLDGIMRFHIYFSPAIPAEQIVGILEYDPGYLAQLFSTAA